MDLRSGESSWSVCKDAPDHYISLESAALTESDGGDALLVCFGERTLEALDPGKFTSNQENLRSHFLV